MNTRKSETLTSWNQAFFYEGLRGEKWDLPGHIMTIHPGPSGLTSPEVLDGKVDGLRASKIKSQRGSLDRHHKCVSKADVPSSGTENERVFRPAL